MIKPKLKECSGCHYMKVIQKNKYIDGVKYQLCRDCVRTEDVKITPTAKQIKKRSEKKILEDKLYQIVRRTHMNKFPNCQANTALCTTTGIEIHHTAGRGINTNNVDTFLTVCRECHNWIHANPKEARELNLLK
jgi:hypothetical protein